MKRICILLFCLVSISNFILFPLTQKSNETTSRYFYPEVDIVS